MGSERQDLVAVWKGHPEASDLGLGLALAEGRAGPICVSKLDGIARCHLEAGSLDPDSSGSRPRR